MRFHVEVLGNIHRVRDQESGRPWFEGNNPKEAERACQLLNTLQDEVLALRERVKRAELNLVNEEHF